ncbi:MAG: KOW domain-containing RNA-binding protein [Oscillospiraceae bacterium]|nr:KOW domain-containing RNA-binding protein [Oscillospiraceae bacterium]
MITGTVVYSSAGRDKHRFYAVVSTEGSVVWIADGKTRKLTKPKRKNLLHLAPTKTVLEPAAMRTDKQLRIALAPLNNRQESAQTQGVEGGLELV